MKYKLNKQERKDILKEVESSYGNKVIGTELESDSNYLILLIHKLYNNIYFREHEDLIRVVNNMDAETMKQVIIKALDKIDKL
jgi:aspartate ammonia-lyase